MNSSLFNVWIPTAEVEVEPGDVLSGNTLGFMKISMWASSEPDLRIRLKSYLSKYSWKLISIEDAKVADPSRDYGDEVNGMIDETLRDHKAIRLGTYYSYKPE